MTPELLSHVLDHARSAVPMEACGLFVWDGSCKAVYQPCRNTQPEGQFQIHPVDWANAEDAGTIIGVVHSHPSGNLAPSLWDTASCLRSKLPWWIVTPDGRWMRMKNALPLHGRPYAWGVQDCYSVLQDWFSFCGVELPDFLRDPHDGQDHYRAHFEECGFKVVNFDRRIGDVLFFGNPTIHAGVYIGEGRFLHHRGKQLSRVEPLDGYWQKELSMSVRRCA